MPRSFPGPLTGCSFTSTSPPSARSSPAIRRSSVDLPQPEGPSRTRNSPTSRPAGENASSISKLMFSSALTPFPSDDGNVRLTFFTVILDFLCSMFRHLQMRGSTRHRDSGARKSRCGLAPWEQLAFKKGQQEAEQKCRNSDGNDPGIHALEVEHFARCLHHVADSFPRIHHLRQDHVGPTDVIKN